MAAMARRLLALYSAASLLLCAAACVLWMRSFWRAEGVDLRLPWERQWSVASGGGLLRFATSPSVGGHKVHWRVWSDAQVVSMDGHYQPILRFAGFGYWGNPYVSAYAISIPHWFPVTLSGFLTFWFHRRWRRFLRSSGLCPRCSYDLRASPARCPECGEPAPSAGV
jgi:hypothetical protein